MLTSGESFKQVPVDDFGKQCKTAPLKGRQKYGRTTVCLHRTTLCITCDSNVHTKQRKADKMEKVCILKTE